MIRMRGGGLGVWCHCGHWCVVVGGGSRGVAVGGYVSEGGGASVQDVLQYVGGWWGFRSGVGLWGREGLGGGVSVGSVARSDGGEVHLEGGL